MQRLQAFKYELRPTGEQRREMRRFAGSCRFVYNETLKFQQARYESGEKTLGYAALCKLLTAWRQGALTPSGRSAAWLAESPIHPLQQALKDLERAYQNFFAQRAALPNLKKKGHNRESFRYPDPKQLKLDEAHSRLFLPKLGWLRYRNSRAALGELRNATVSYSAGKWLVSIQTEREAKRPVPKSGCAVGIDVGVARFATLSDGTFLEPRNSFKHHEERLRRAQRALSRKVKFSRNWRKAKTQVQRIHARIGNVRRDFLHQATSTICQNHAIVCIEDLQVRKLSRSAAGTADAPGKNVRAKSGLNKAILDQGWSEFRRQLEYKLQWAGGHLIAVAPQNTSRTCPCCGHGSAGNRFTQARFLCVECGFAEHADRVGAINILSRGMQLLRDQGQDTAEAPAGCPRTSQHECTARIACEVSGA
ncbi:MAG: RNA-guided endonuclease InsQ/TnpB family protein [Steroidobacteraceae bacterium]